MYNYLLPVLAAFGCALCNGTAAVLQKISADKEKNASSLDAKLLWRLFHNKPYVVGTVLDIIGWAFTLYAVRFLPLFLVEAIIAANIAITAIIERLFRNQALSYKSYASIFTIIGGLVLVAIASSPQRAEPISNFIKWIIIFAPVPIAAIGYALARMKSIKSVFGLAALGGLAFGCTSVIGRIYSFPSPLWHVVYNPLTIAIVASGSIGLLLFSTALQRAQATAMNATMTASQTLIPAIIGIVFLGDDARNGLWFLVILGSILTLSGVLILASGYKNR